MEQPYHRAIIMWHKIKTYRERRRHDAALKRTIETIRCEHRRSVEFNLPHYSRLYNVALYLLLFEQDFVVLKWDGFYTTRSSKRNLTTRLIGLMAYETANDLSNLLGREFRDTLSQFPIDTDQWEAFNTLTSELAKFKRENRIFLKEMRNFVTAHREQEASKQLDVIEAVDFERTMRIAGDLYNIIRKLYIFLIHVITVGSNSPVQLKHLLMRETTG